MWKAMIVGSALVAGCGSGKSTEPTPIPNVESTPPGGTTSQTAALFERCLLKSAGADAIPLPEFFGRVEACRNSTPGLTKGEFVKILQSHATVRDMPGKGRGVGLSKVAR